MASPHAVGVAALIVSRFGQPDPQQRLCDRADPEQTETDPQEHRDAAPVPDAAGARLHERRQAPVVHGDLHRHGR